MGDDSPRVTGPSSDPRIELEARRRRLQTELYSRAAEGGGAGIPVEDAGGFREAGHHQDAGRTEAVRAELLHIERLLDEQVVRRASRGRADGTGGVSEAAAQPVDAGDLGHGAEPRAGSADESGSSASWLAAVARSKVAAWNARADDAERIHARSRAGEPDDASTGVFAGTPDSTGMPLPPTSDLSFSERLRRRPFALAAIGLVVGGLGVAAGVGYGVGAHVSAEREAAAGVRSSAPPTDGADDAAADWRTLASQQALAEFSRNQLSGDLPPDSVSDDHFRADSFRLLLTGSIADWTGRVYAAKDIEGEICVVLVQPDSSYSAGCATPDQFARGGVQVTTDVSITIRADEDGSESTITGVTATWPANGMTGLRFSSARTAN